MAFQRTFANLVSPVPLSYLDDNFGALTVGTTSTTTLSGAALIQYIQPGTNAVSRTVQAKLNEAVSVLDFGAVGDGVTDDTTAFQDAIDSGAKRVVCPAPGQYFLNGAIITIDLSDFEFVIEAGAALIKGNSGATLHVGSVAGTYSNIKITGRGKITPSAVPHSVPSAGILVGANSVTVDNLTVDVDIINMGQYGIASGSIAATITNFCIPNDVILSVDCSGAWMGVSDVAQAFDFNVPSGTNCGGRIGAAKFKVTDGVGFTDAFKWTNFTGTITGAWFEGGSATVLALSQANNFVVSGIKLIKTFNGGAGLVIGTTSTAGQINGVDAKTATTTIPMLFLAGSSTLTGIQVSDFRTGGVIGAGTSTASNCDLRNITATGGGIDFSSITSFSDGVIDSCKTSGRIFVIGNDNTVRNCDVSMGAAAVEGIMISGNDNRILYNTVRDTTDRGIEIAGNANLLHEFTADNCGNSARIVSGTSNIIGNVILTNGSGAIEDSGTTTIMPFTNRTGLSGSTTIAVGSNPTKRTSVKFSALGGATTLTNITGAAVGDEVTLVNEDASSSVTLDRSNAVLAGGANAVLGQYDTLRVVFTDSLWHELSRSANS